jgi:hypothetical protein
LFVQFFSYPAAVTITGERTANLDLCLALLAFGSEGFLLCHQKHRFPKKNEEGTQQIITNNGKQKRRETPENFYMHMSYGKKSKGTQLRNHGGHDNEM